MKALQLSLEMALFILYPAMVLLIVVISIL
jgi:hypothetical protein